MWPYVQYVDTSYVSCESDLSLGRQTPICPNWSRWLSGRVWLIHSWHRWWWTFPWSRAMIWSNAKRASQAYTKRQWRRILLARWWQWSRRSPDRSMANACNVPDRGIDPRWDPTARLGISNWLVRAPVSRGPSPARRRRMCAIQFERAPLWQWLL